MHISKSTDGGDENIKSICFNFQQLMKFNRLLFLLSLTRAIINNTKEISHALSLHHLHSLFTSGIVATTIHFIGIFFNIAWHIFIIISISFLIIMQKSTQIFVLFISCSLKQIICHLQHGTREQDRAEWKKCERFTVAFFISVMCMLASPI